MASRTRAGIPVRGICKAGHVTERESDPGRVTWNGQCPHEGCEHTVYARRIPRNATPPPPAPDEDAGTTRVVRIADYDDTAHPGDDPGTVVVGEPGPDPEPVEPAATVAGGDGAGAGDPLPDPVDDLHRPGFGQRFAERRRAARVRSARQPYRHPLGI